MSEYRVDVTGDISSNVEYETASEMFDELTDTIEGLKLAVSAETGEAARARIDQVFDCMSKFNRTDDGHLILKDSRWHLKEDVLDEEVDQYIYFATQAREFGVLSEDDRRLVHQAFPSYEFRGTWRSPALYRYDTQLDVPIDECVTLRILPECETWSDDDQGDGAAAADLAARFELDEYAKSWLQRKAGEITRVRMNRGEGANFLYQYSPLELDIMRDQESGGLCARLGWTLSHMSPEGYVNGGRLQFNGVEVDVDKALDMIQELVQYYEEKADAGIASILSNEGKQELLRVATERTENDTETFIAQFRADAPEMGEIDDTTLKELMKTSKKNMYSSAQDLHEYAQELMLTDRAKVSYYCDKGGRLSEEHGWYSEYYTLEVSGVESAALGQYYYSPAVRFDHLESKQLGYSREQNERLRREIMARTIARKKRK